ncbi:MULTISPECIES: helix-turn-helix domain-containing protein [Streptomyces]|uniref:helix-turn-helix domain-containing protein n=1 Tax=Streptomyces TaxID=1883 RepID=UPI001302A404|nr:MULTISPECIES: helix-turn-helix domain-containing protein [Streptomyces]
MAEAARVPQDALVRQAAEAFAAKLIRLRTGRGLSQSALARRMGYDKSYVTHVERCTQAPTRSFAQQADRVLGSGQALSRLWQAYHTVRANDRRRPPQTRPSALATPGAPDGSGGQDDEAAREAKAGVNAVTTAMAAELGGKSVLVNAVAPGNIDTEMTRAAGTAVVDWAVQTTPVGRLGSADEVAEAIVHLVLSDFVCGHTFVVDGGQLLRI